MVGTASRAYIPTGGDQGKAVKVRVSFTDDAGNWETRTSAQTATVGARADNPGICDRTERVRDNIISLLNAQDLGSLGIKDCSEVTDEHLIRIRFLDLTGGGIGQKITSLKPGDFHGLSGMSELILADNSLSELPEGVFDGLSSLEILTMQGNDLGSLPDGVFDDLTNLDALAMYDNDLAALPDGVFDGLTKLSTLAISDNKLTALPDGIFSGMSKLQTVSLSGNPGSPFTLRADLEQEDAGGVVVKVAEGAPFTMTVTLSAEGGTLSATTVVIDGGDTESAVLTVAPEGSGAVTVSVGSAAFSDAGTVQDGIQTGVGESLTLEAAASGICDRTAQVRDAILEMLPYTNDCVLVTETDLRSITRLWLKEKGITTLKSGDFSGLSNLQLLHLADNELRALPDGIFDKLTALWSLTLDGNDLSELPDGVFDNLTELEDLYLLRNELSRLPEGIFYGLANLDVLNIDDNAGSPFILTAELERTGENTIALKIAQATPFDMEVTLSAEGGSLSSATVFIPAGNVSSAPVNVSPDGDGAVTIRVVSAAFLLGESQEARGIQTGLGDSLTLGEDSDTNTPATGELTISGTAQVGETLRTDTSDIEDANGLANATFSYRWVSSDGTTDTDIEKATNSTYKLVAADQGKSIKVIVTFADDAGNEETLTSAPAGPVLREPVLGDGPPGAPRNLTITAGDQEITLSWEPPEDNGNPPVKSYRIEWRIDGKDYNKSHWDLARKTTYTKTQRANGVKYIFRVKAQNDNGYGPPSEEVGGTPTSGSAVNLGTPVLSKPKTLHHGMVKLDWEDIEDAGWYVVQYYHVGHDGAEWLDLPAVGVETSRSTDQARW